MRDTDFGEKKKKHNMGVEIIIWQYSAAQWQYAVKSQCSAHRHENKMMLDLPLQGMGCCLNIHPIILCHRQQ